MQKLIFVNVETKEVKTQIITEYNDLVGVEGENLFIKASNFNSPSDFYV